MGHRSIANTVIYTAVADKRIRNMGQMIGSRTSGAECINLGAEG
jgi:hypothetical protein